MLAILGGLGAAFAFAATTLCSSRSARMLGPPSVLAWVMLVGLLVTGPAAAAEGVPSSLGAGSAGWLAVAGVGNVAGLLLTYAALRIGKVAIVAPIVSAEGAIAAVISVGAGEKLAAGTAATLGVIAAGIVLASVTRDETSAGRDGLRPALLAVSAAILFGASLYATGRVGAELPVFWAVLPARVVGVLAVALPLAVAGRLRLTRPAVPLVVTGGLGEVAGFACFTLGARHGLAVSAVLASQFAAIAAVLAFLLFRERLLRVQTAGVVTIVGGVAALSALQA